MTLLYVMHKHAQMDASLLEDPYSTTDNYLKISKSTNNICNIYKLMTRSC